MCLCSSRSGGPRSILGVISTCSLPSKSIMPHAIALGTWQLKGQAATDLVRGAILEGGVREIDCAWEYLNEVEIGVGVKEAIQTGVVSREDLTITSKLWGTFHRPELVRPALLQSLDNLGVSYLDTYIIHWPMSFRPMPVKEGDGLIPPYAAVTDEMLYPRGEDGKIAYDRTSVLDTWRAMEALVDEGLVRHIGVSNFPVILLHDLLCGNRHPVYCNQIELHCLLQQRPLVDYCIERGVRVVGYSPLGGSYTYGAHKGVHLLANSVVGEVAERHSCTPAQVLLRYLTQRYGDMVTLIPRTRHVERTSQNLAAQSITLDEEAMESLLGLDANIRFNDAGGVHWGVPSFD
ncbi:aldo/keto reductase [Kipferlia bialata]|uniref:Aldo/keto reductase n=1 Tax=Kipferlia bialata TaxID=797122 RepID=A0A9K3GF20_9EUKA|nr:aldo/keto reductase [Kipferlia bialata]|eukprot:g2547.t1